MTDKPMTQYEYFIQQDKEFREETIYAAHKLEEECLEEIVDYDEIIDRLRANLSLAYKIRDLAKDKLL